MATVTLQGNPFNTNGDLPAVGSAAPDFNLVAKDLADVSLATYAGKKKLISIVPTRAAATRSRWWCRRTCRSRRGASAGPRGSTTW